MNYTNLNIISQKGVFQYIVEYYDDKNVQSTPLQYYKTNAGIFFLSNNKTNVIHNKNYWKNEYENGSHTQQIKNDYVPVVYNKSSFNLYFPRFSVETYEHNIKYVLTINTWINGEYVFLGSYLIDRSEAIACESGPRKFLNQEYYEYIHIDTIDPVYLNYGDEWKDFRVNVCGEKVFNNEQKNNNASNINLTLTPVKFFDDTWIKIDNLDNSQSAITLNNSINNYMKNNIVFDIVNGNPVFKCGISYNTLYNSFEEYMKETYQIDINNLECKISLFIKDKNNIYKYIEHVCDNPHNKTVFNIDEFKFDNWSEYVNGMCAFCVFTIGREDSELIAISSNYIMINKDVFKYLVCDSPIKKLNFDLIDMTTNNFDVVNVIENKIVQVDRPEDYKANIIKPIFVKVQESGTIRLHKSVTENIVINLDAYKNKVESFIIKINDINFYEIGRINSGVIFKIIGNNLGDTEKEGTYYILNEDGELVTTGKYIIIQ